MVAFERTRMYRIWDKVYIVGNAKECIENDFEINKIFIGSAI